MIETVKDPFCFPFIGESLANEFGDSGNAELRGVEHQAAGNQESQTVFAQAHYFEFPVWQETMGQEIENMCWDPDNDGEYMTEFDIMWQDDEIMSLLHPESLLFANTVAVYACIADSVASNIGLPLAPLFWCIGSYSSVYPLAGRIQQHDYVQSNAALAARMIYKLAREHFLLDMGIYICWGVPTPIWVKWNYRLQLIEPVASTGVIPIGRTGVIWSYFKNPPNISMGDNFLWIVFRKHACCAS